MSIKSIARNILGKCISPFGYDIVPRRPVQEFPVDFSPDEQAVWRYCRKFTLTAPGSLIALTRAVEYVCLAGVPGDIVECGVWAGGSMAGVAMTLKRLEESRGLWLYDTFDVFRRPHSDLDVNWKGETAEERKAAEGENWGGKPIDAVRKTLADTGYPESRMKFVKGYVEDTIPVTKPDRIALLRVDTDFYDSTKIELEHLYPRLSPGGILIIDDYGCWQGARKAADEYFAAQGIVPFLCRIEGSPVVMQKPHC